MAEILKPPLTFKSKTPQIWQTNSRLQHIVFSLEFSYFEEEKNHVSIRLYLLLKVIAYTWYNL